MKRFYIIAPVLLITAFGYFFNEFTKIEKQKADEHSAAQALTKEIEAKKKAETEQKAREDAAQRVAAREAEAKKKEADQQAKWEADQTQLLAETGKYAARIAKQTEEILSLEKKLEALRADIKQRTKANFDAALTVETLNIKRHTAELEIQRVNKIIVKRALASAAVVPPVPTAVPSSSAR